MSHDENELNFESDDDTKNLSFTDNSRNTGNKFNLRHQNNINTREQINIKPMLGKDSSQAPSHQH